MSECVQMYNLLLLRLNVATTLTSKNEINSELLIALYRSVSADTEPSVTGDPVKALNYIISSLETLLGTELDHISAQSLLDKEDEALYNISEIYLGLLDLIEDTKENDDNTQDLCNLNDSTIDQLKLESSCPFSPIPDSTQDQIFRTKFPAVVNSSYSGSEADPNDYVIKWVNDRENRDSSRSDGLKSVSEGASKSSKSLFAKIENKINATSNHINSAVKTTKVSTRLSSADLNWTTDCDSGRTSDLIRSVPDSVSFDYVKSAPQQPMEKTNGVMDTLDLSAIEKTASDGVTAEENLTNKTLTPRAHTPDINRTGHSHRESLEAKYDSTATEDIVARIEKIETEMTANPKPQISTESTVNSVNTNESNNKSSDTNELIGISADISDESMKFLIQALQKTVEDSQKTRLEFEKQKAESERAKKSFGKISKSYTKTESDAAPQLPDDIHENKLYKNADKKIKSTMKKSKKNQEFNPEKEMKKLLDRENELNHEKQKLVCEEFENELNRMNEKNKCELKVPFPSAGNVRFDVPKSPEKKSKSPEKKSKPKKSKGIGKVNNVPTKTLYKNKLVIDEGEMLQTIMDEIPGLDYDRETMKLLMDNQDRQLMLLDKEARQYASKIRQKDQKVANVRERQRMMTKIVNKEEAAAKRAADLKAKKQEESRLTRELQAKRQKNAKIKKYFDEYQTGLRKSLTKKKYQEEQMLKRIFEEGLATQKTRLRELRSYAQEMREKENNKRETELEAIENFYRDKFEILASDMKAQKAENERVEKEHKRKISSAKSGLTKRLESEIREMQACIIQENESMFYRDLEEQRLKKEIQMAKFKSQIHNVKHSA